jgi:lycopene beta-cyclase
LDADILIAGAGCAGLSLAVHLLDEGASDIQILLLDIREVHVRDRTWCYWSVLDHPFQPAVRHLWHRWKVVTPDDLVERGSRFIAYCCIPADALYDMALERIEQSANVRIVRGVSVESFRDATDGVIAVTDSGELTGRLAFDSRPPDPVTVPRGEIHWLQHFVGLEIETAEPAFDPSVATLMDFRVVEDDDIRFMYVLPFDERTALVEETFFGGEPRPESQYVNSIDGYLRERLGVESWREVHREKGAIPMSTLPPPVPEASRVTNIGTRAGLARPSTGYAFLAIQRQSRRLARHIVDVGLERPVPRTRPYSRATAFLDRVFLAYLERHPAEAPAMFLRMFEGVAPERLARFIFDGGSTADRMTLMKSLPAVPLMRQALRSLAGF